MKEIGGYFGLEMRNHKTDYPFKDVGHAIHLNSGRHSLEYILRQFKRKPSRVYLPFYTCEVVLEPLRRLGIEWQFYTIDENLEIRNFPELKEREYMIVNNYFGIKDQYVNQLSQTYGKNLIIDDAQALFHTVLPDCNQFFSPRKFVGVPDGGIAWTVTNQRIDLPRDVSTDRSIHLLRRIDSGAQSGFEEFRENDSELSQLPMRSMSNLTQELLKIIDYEYIVGRRRSNFDILQLTLAQDNKLNISTIDSFRCPMVYPFWTDDTSLRKRLIKNNIFVATYWPNVTQWRKEGTLEYELSLNLLPLPIDQRYGDEEMYRILEVVHSNK